MTSYILQYIGTYSIFTIQNIYITININFNLELLRNSKNVNYNKMIY